MVKKLLLYCSFILLVNACSKDKNVVFKENKPVDPTGIPTIVVENYVNRIFIDLLGRAPTDIELKRFTDELKANELNEVTRLFIIKTLQTDSIELHDDGTYKDIYYLNFYNNIKAKCLEGASDGELAQNIGNISFDLKIARLYGDSIRVYNDSARIKRLEKILQAKNNYKNGNIDIRYFFEYAMNNDVYDVINMNSFNFINASYDDLFSRFPTKQEFYQSYEIIEYNRSGFLFGGSASNKNEYCHLLTSSLEFSEGVIRWQYLLLLSREPSTEEIARYMNQFHTTKNVQWIQQELIKTNEYANFK